MVTRSEVEINFERIISKYTIAEQIGRILWNNKYSKCNKFRDIEVLVPKDYLSNILPSFVGLSNDIIGSKVEFDDHLYHFEDVKEVTDEILENYNSITLCIKLWNARIGGFPVAHFTFFYKEKIS